MYSLESSLAPETHGPISEQQFVEVSKLIATGVRRAQKFAFQVRVSTTFPKAQAANAADDLLLVHHMLKPECDPGLTDPYEIFKNNTHLLHSIISAPAFAAVYSTRLSPEQGAELIDVWAGSINLRRAVAFGATKRLRVANLLRDVHGITGVVEGSSAEQLLTYYASSGKLWVPRAIKNNYPSATLHDAPANMGALSIALCEHPTDLLPNTPQIGEAALMPSNS